MNYFIKTTLLCSLSLCNLLCNAVPNQVNIDKTTQYDLDLSCQKDKSALPETIKTITIAGKDSIEPFLLHPTYSIKTLKERQEVILFFLEQESLYNSLQQQLTALAPHEHALTIEKSDPLSEHALKKVYFSLNSLQQFNTSPYALDLAYVMHITGLCLPLAEYLMLHAGFNFFAHAHDDHDDHDHSSCGHDHISPDASNLEFYSFHAALLGVHIPALVDMTQNINQRAVMIKLLQQQMIHVATYVKTAKRIFALLKNYQADSLNFAPYKELAYFFDVSPNCSLQAQNLLKLLEEPTFTGNASVINHVGNVLAAYKLYTQVHQEFHKLTHALGEIDMYVSAATIMKKQTPAAPWCFVSYTESTQPLIVAKSMRHLFITATQSKNWDINNQDLLHAFITGENGSGKSTYINGIGHALILAQTFGIAPAQEFEITPFSHICTYRFIQDDIAAGTSRFYAECGRIDAILNTAGQGSELSCVLLDEPFTSTNAQKGSDFLETALSKLYEKNNVISFTASHYTALSALAKEHKKTKHLHLC